ncbi:YqjF family protein [Halorubrum sp. DTA46]|uniref:YqjF family protein n=1 Tax=Halorubrum sp. DTA46 TaxID=3402162 RepID=UPI003AAC9D1C
MLRRRWLEMTWRDGLFLHWPVDPAVVAETLPDRLSVATHDGDAYLGVVAFVMDDIRPRGAPFGLSFPELNLRTYVEGPAGPGVYFYNLDADDRLGVAVARRLFALPYYRAAMDVTREPTAGAEDTVRFASRRTHSGVPSARFDATYRPEGEPFTAESVPLDAFLVENYRFYAEGDALYKGEIAHDPWRLREATAEVRTNTLFEANGFDRPEGEPLVRYAEPIDVSADRIRRV